MGCDVSRAVPVGFCRNFNPRTPCGVRPALYACFKHPGLFQSTHPVWGATEPARAVGPKRPYFNPRTPCGVRPGVPSSKKHHQTEFQSTHPVWGATSALWLTVVLPDNFNPRTPCGVRRADLTICHYCHRISIHAPRVGCDVVHRDGAGLYYGISIHAPRVGCDPGQPVAAGKSNQISIHAPRVGCDHRLPAQTSYSGYFNPRTPCGVRRETGLCGIPHRQFQSTHPVWGATTKPRSLPLRGFYFNPRTPCGVRRCLCWPLCGGGQISIHAPRVGCDFGLKLR